MGYIDAVALAYWGFYLHTKAYMLAGMLHYNFGLYHKGQPVI